MHMNVCVYINKFMHMNVNIYIYILTYVHMYITITTHHQSPFVITINHCLWRRPCDFTGNHMVDELLGHCAKHLCVTLAHRLARRLWPHTGLRWPAVFLRQQIAKFLHFFSWGLEIAICGQARCEKQGRAHEEFVGTTLIRPPQSWCLQDPPIPELFLPPKMVVILTVWSFLKWGCLPKSDDAMVDNWKSLCPGPPPFQETYMFSC